MVESRILVEKKSEKGVISLRSSDAQQHVFAASRLDAVRLRGEPASMIDDPVIPNFTGSPNSMERKKLQERLKQS
ncbi:hypothetical protein CHH91_05285 [Virgibacillus sp. 7505]|nr:hypothetical protein CHH91_05285 [Virgibacillus sp. 7505]